MQEKLDGNMLRSAMRRVPSPVTVVTVAGADELRGITIGSFTSVSLEPSLICFNVAHDAQAHEVIIHAERFAVHILTDEQAYLSDHFAIPDRTGEEQFADLEYRLDQHGTPLLNDALTIFHCKHFATHPAGDHTLLLGEVTAIQEYRAGEPLIYYDRTYRSIGELAKVSALSPVKRGSNASS
jgi:flavin reductase (DIM6/NTAB) family NADH-FMN oxidoreductase RutF